MQVTLLGTAGWMPTDQRETTCFAARVGDTLLVFDAGTGLRRLLDRRHGELREDAAEIHIFLTHYHLDHVCGLAYLSGVFPQRQITIHAPAQALTGVDPETALSGLLRRPYNPHDWEELTHVKVEEIGPDTEVAGRRIRVRLQNHSDASVAYRVDDAFVLATDTTADSETARFAAGAGLLLHETWFTLADGDDLPPGYASHSAVEDVARLAAEADVGRLVLMHLNPLHDEAYYAALAASGRRIFARTELRHDGDVVATDAVPY